MKIKVTVTLILLSLASFILILAHATAAETIDLSGEWDAIFIRMREDVGKGKLSNGKLEEIFLSYPIDQITYKLDWSKGRATINEVGDLILFYSALQNEPVHLTFVLKKRK